MSSNWPYNYLILIFINLYSLKINRLKFSQTIWKFSTHKKRRKLSCYTIKGKKQLKSIVMLYYYLLSHLIMWKKNTNLKIFNLKLGVKDFFFLHFSWTYGKIKFVEYFERNDCWMWLWMTCSCGINIILTLLWLKGKRF